MLQPPTSWDAFQADPTAYGVSVSERPGWGLYVTFPTGEDLLWRWFIAELLPPLALLLEMEQVRTASSDVTFCIYDWAAWTAMFAVPLDMANELSLCWNQTCATFLDSAKRRVTHVTTKPRPITKYKGG